MKFLRKLFGAKNTPQETAAPASPPLASSTGDPIRVFDKFGREMEIERREWIKLMQDNLRKHWNDPETLAGHVVQALQDGLFAEIEDAAFQLHKIDSEPSRGITLLAIVHLQTGRPAEAERLLAAHIAKHGEDGVVLTNLAKAQSALGHDADSVATLWRALELDPNQDNGLGWYEVIHREKFGEQGALDALRRIAALPGSWRAQLWLARHELANHHLDEAITLYREALDHAPQPTPTDLLMQMSGDLGNQGHLIPLLELTGPHFDRDTHGITVGNNLLKALIDTGQHAQARRLLDQLQAMQRPDWRETLGHWESELHKARIGAEETPSAEQLQVTMLSLKGPLWLPDSHPLAARYPAKSPDALRIVVSGSTFESPNMGSAVKTGPTDSPGRYSRALPLFFTEWLSLGSDASATTLIPWVLNGHGGFMLAGKPSSEEEIANLARMAQGKDPPAPDFALNFHLIVRGENFTMRLRLVRCIDARCVGEITRDFPDAGFHRVAGDVLAELRKLLADEADVSLSADAASLQGPELDHYLFRLEQSLAVSTSTMKEQYTESLSNPAEILDGMLQLCLQTPHHLPSRMLLLRTLRKLRKSQPDLTAALRPKFEALMIEHPIESARKELDDELASAFEEG